MRRPSCRKEEPPNAPTAPRGALRCGYRHDAARERSLGTDLGAEGRINFTKAAESDFDSYTPAPSSARTQWMRDHYWRMRAYSPYFDSRTTWYPGAWAYRDAYAIYRGSAWPPSTLTGC